MISYDTETGEFHHYGANVSLDYALNDVLTISPYVAWNIIDDGAELGALNSSAGPGSIDDEFFGGIILTAGF